MIISKISAQHITTSGSYNLVQGNSIFHVLVLCFQYAMDSSTPPTFNGIAGTLWGQVESQYSNPVFLWYFLTPADGIHTFVPNGYNNCAVYSFNNVYINSFFDNYNYGSGATGGDVYVGITPSVNNGYLVFIYGGNSGNNFISAASGQTDVYQMGTSACMLHTSPGAGVGVIYHTNWANYTGGFLSWVFSLVPLYPVIDSISPSSGSPLGGTAVTITGGFFEAGSTVTFGGVSATSVVVVNSTTITCVTPANPVGQVTIAVSANSQTGYLTNGFTYATNAGLLMVSD